MPQHWSAPWSSRWSAPTPSGAACARRAQETARDDLAGARHLVVPDIAGPDLPAHPDRVGHADGRLLRHLAGDRHLDADPGADEVAHLRHLLQLFAVDRAAVPADGAVRDARRHVAGA